MPDRLPSLVLLVGCWVPSLLAGRAAAEFALRRTNRMRPAVIYAGMAVFILASSAVWYFINLSAVPPYIPGAIMDPTYVPPGAESALALVTATVVLPASAVACVVAFRMRLRASKRPQSR